MSLQEQIQADFVGAETNVHGVPGQTWHSPRQLPDRRSDGEC